MTKDEQLKIYAAYLPYKLKGKRADGGKGDYILRAIYDDGSVIWKYDGFGNSTQIGVKPILYDLSWLTKEELYKAGFTDHVDWLTNEREALISRYGIEKYLSKTPFGHIQYLLSEHYNVFGIPAGEFIDKSTLKTESND